MDEQLELLASVQHDIWSHWMKYLFSICQVNEDGSVIISKEKVDRWTRQLNTPYSKLSEKEKDSDRHQAKKIISANL